MLTDVPTVPESWLPAVERVLRRVVSSADGEGVLAALTAGLVHEFDAALARIWLYDPADETFHARSTAGDVRDLSGSTTHIHLRDTTWPIAHALVNREVVVIDEIRPGRVVRDPGWAEREGLRSFAGYPLVVGDRLIGAMVLYRRTPLTDAILNALQILAFQAALAVEHARLMERSQVLQRIATELATARDARTLLHGLVERVMLLVGADGCGVWLVGEDEAAAAQGLSPAFARRRQTGSFFDDVTRYARPLFTRDALAAARERGDQDLAERMDQERIVSALRVPLITPDKQVVGMLALYHRRERLYSDAELPIVEGFSDQIAVAVQNARLVEQERSAREAATQQLERFTTLGTITERLLASTDLDSVLQVVVKAGWQLCGASGAALALIDDEQRTITPVARDGEPMAYLEQFRTPLLDAAFYTQTLSGRALSRREPVAIADYTQWSSGDPLQESTVQLGVRAGAVAPLLLHGDPIGVLCVTDVRARAFTSDDLTLIQALANQAALAIEQARLLLQSREATVLEERTRLARDLHDSVTQSVFSLGMLAQAAQLQHERGSAQLGATLSRIGTLSDEALKEMRALMFQLQPVGLEEGLVSALQRLAASFQVRSDLVVRVTACSQRRLAMTMEEAVFRIVQEAMSNASKHADAGSVQITVTELEDRLRVEVVDDGRGFDQAAPAGASADGRRGGMGLRSMRERARAAGLLLQIAAAPGQGTTVVVEAPLPAAKE